METPAERAARVRRLEEGRAGRRGEAFSPPDSTPIELAPGRGDLNFTSVALGGNQPLQSPLALWMLGGRVASFAQLFASQPWVAAAVMRMLTWAVRVPLKVYQRTGDDTRVRLRPEDHPLADAVVRPWQRGTQAGLVMSMLGPLLVHGNSVVEFNSIADQIDFVPHDWRYTQPIMADRNTIDGYRFDYDQPKLSREAGVENVIHTAWWSPLGPPTGGLGLSPLQQLGVTLQIEDAAQRWQTSMMKQGARPPSAVTADEAFLGIEKTTRDKIMAQLRADLMAIYSGPENAGRPALLPPGLDWKAIGHTAVEAQLIEQRKVTREEVCAVYLIPPPMLGILERATFNNIQTLREMTYTDCLGPPLVLIEQLINATLVYGHLLQDDVYCEFDFGGVLRGDRLAEIEALREGVASALYTPNEARSYLNMPRSDEPDMDKFFLPFNNLQPVGTAPRPSGGFPSRGPGSPPPGGGNDAPVPPEPKALHVRSREADYVKEMA
jgi:HK97 family phage portal protein